MMLSYTEEQAAHQKQLLSYIHNQIHQNQGKIPFSQFMQLALYAPGLGYYSAGASKIGSSGDFITAPELSDQFAYAFAEQCKEVLRELGGGSILEFGAGTGRLAADLLKFLEASEQLPEKYYILEVSADLKERQKTLIEATFPHLLPKVVWLESLDNLTFKGLVIANEILDAMPVEIFKRYENEILQCYVVSDNQDFKSQFLPPSREVKEAVQALNLQEDNYQSEINLRIQPWLKSIHHVLEQGLILLCDYGFSQHEYYHPARSMGTLMCHFQHQAHPDPFIHVGLQDITSHVDFTAVAEAAFNAGFNIAGFTTQAYFLLGCGIVNTLDFNDASMTYEKAQAIKKLTSPSEMGELFKVIFLTKNYEKDLLGAQFMNLINRL